SWYSASESGVAIGFTLIIAWKRWLSLAAVESGSAAVPRPYETWPVVAPQGFLAVSSASRTTGLRVETLSSVRSPSCSRHGRVWRAPGAAWADEGHQRARRDQNEAAISRDSLHGRHPANRPQHRASNSRSGNAPDVTGKKPSRGRPPRAGAA